MGEHRGDKGMEQHMGEAVATVEDVSVEDATRAKRQRMDAHPRHITTP